MPDLIQVDDDIMPDLIPDNEIEIEMIQNDQINQNEENNYQEPPNINHVKLSRELRRLDGFFNPQATLMHRQIQEIIERENPPIQQIIQRDNPEIIENANESSEEAKEEIKTSSEENSTNEENNNDMISDQALYMVTKIPTYPKNFMYKMSEESGNPFLVDSSQLKDIIPLPYNYEQAWYAQHPWSRAKWRDAITLELNKMKDLKVWHAIKKNQVPTGCKCIKNKWVFDIKRNGTFRARLVACGYSQTPGIDFQDYYAPVINNVVFRIMIILQITYKLQAVIIDVETAFLHGDLSEEIYMHAPKGANLKSDECVKLDKALYGLVQAARQFYLKFAKVLEKIGFEQSYAEPCLFFRNTKNGKVIMIMHIDDFYVIGNSITIKEVIEDLKKSGLKLKVSYQASDYLSCDIQIDNINNMAWICQQTLLKKTEKKFGPLLSKIGHYNYKTPGTPGKYII
jgi:hypothetical protein